MKVYLYEIKLLDPLFYSREGLSASFTVGYLHATAINLAITSALNLLPKEQPYLIMNTPLNNRNNPKYTNSLISDKFYFTPARLKTPLKYFPEITKGENDGYIFKTKQGEVLQAGILHYISPESLFYGFLIEKEPYKWPTIIRLGSFRGKAKLELKELEFLNLIEVATASHPVDPLITKVKRGFMVNMFPYPIVDNALVHHGIKTKQNYIIAFPDSWQLPKVEVVKGKTPII